MPEGEKGRRFCDSRANERPTLRGWGIVCIAVHGFLTFLPQAHCLLCGEVHAVFRFFRVFFRQGVFLETSACRGESLVPIGVLQVRFFRGNKGYYIIIYLFS